jgi:hypothetical protein
MIRKCLTLSFALLVALVAAGPARAEVTSVRMHIAGYLCGN